MATSTVPALKANLLTQLQARGGLAGVQVTYGPPLPNPDREFIWLGDVQGDQAFSAMAAPNQRHEQYTLQVIVSVLREGTDLKTADERCFALCAELENQLRTDVTVNSAVSEAHVGTFRLTEFVAPDGMNRRAELIVDVNCQAWI